MRNNCEELMLSLCEVTQIEKEVEERTRSLSDFDLVSKELCFLNYIVRISQV